MPGSEEKYRLIFDTSEDALFLVQPDGSVIEANPAASECLGYSLQELLALSVNDLFESGHASPLTLFAEPEHAPESTSYQALAVRKDDTSFPVEVRARGFVEDNASQYLLSLHDISHRKEAERTMRQISAENARLLESEREQRVRAETLREVTSILSSSLDQDHVLQLILEQLARVIPYDSASIMLVAENELTTVAQRKFRSAEQLFNSLHVKFLKHIQEVIDTRRPLVIADTANDPRWFSTAHSAYIRCWLGAPLSVQNRVIGVLNLDKEQSGFYTEQDAELAMAFASQAALAMENARLFADAQLRAEEAETLRAATAAVTATLNLDEAIDRILVQLERVIPYDSASVQLLRNGYLEIVGGRGWANINDVTGLRFPIPGENPNSMVIMQHKAIILADASLIYPSFWKPPHSNIHGWMGVPLQVYDRTIGMLALDSERPNFYTQRHLRMARAFADQVAIAIENARLYTAERQRVDEQDALRATIADITAELELPRLLEAVLKRATTLLNATGGDLGLYDDTRHDLEVVVSHNMGKDFTGTRMAIGEGAMGQVALSGESVIIDEYHDWEYRSSQYLNGDFHAVLAVPLIITGHLAGALGIVDKNPERKFTESDQRLLSLFAQQAAIAVQNARLFSEVQRLATYDSVIDIFNRRHMLELGQREFNRALRFGHPLSAVMIDIDHFKLVNDRFGHATGDKVLYVLAQRIQKNIRTVDILARYGGEEYIILLPETNLEDALKVGERVRMLFEEPIEADEDLQLIQVTASIGVATLTEETPDLRMLIANADTAMYVAKDAGRNRVEMFVG